VAGGLAAGNGVVVAVAVDVGVAVIVAVGVGVAGGVGEGVAVEVGEAVGVAVGVTAARTARSPDHASAIVEKLDSDAENVRLALSKEVNRSAQVSPLLESFCNRSRPAANSPRTGPRPPTEVTSASVMAMLNLAGRQNRRPCIAWPPWSKRSIWTTRRRAVWPGTR
jgi:hypothetical protein